VKETTVIIIGGGATGIGILRDLSMRGVPALLLEQGQLDVLVQSETTRLNAGDTTVVQSNLPHIVSNPGDTTAVGLAVFTPAIWFPNNRRSFNRGGET
jgi:glycine/D-amino acid oxidase-like deaminating enzyme